MNITHHQVCEHLHALRREAAQARLVPGRPGILTGVLRLLTSWRTRPAAPQNGVRHT